MALRKFEQFDLTDFTAFYDNAAAAVATAKAETDGDCRIEKNFLHTLNDPFLLGYWGISHYSSTKASTAKELLEQLGYVGYSTYGWAGTGVADSLLGIRWLYSDGSRRWPGTGSRWTATLPILYIRMTRPSRWPTLPDRMPCP